MKRRILALGMVLALVAVMALPMAVFAASGTTAVTGNLAQTFTLVAPSPFALGTTPGTLALGTNGNPGSSATAGSVVTDVTGWALIVSDTKAHNTGYMTIGGADAADAVPLHDAIQVGTTAPTAGTAVGTIATYQTALQNAAGYSSIVGPGAFSITLCANQTVEATDAAGSYQITLTYTATPGF